MQKALNHTEVLRGPEPSRLAWSCWDVRIRVLMQCAPTWIGCCDQQRPADQSLTLRSHLTAVILGENDVSDHVVGV